eukprot:Phypoly_transcript_15954.p1 GENE.Phypoly_transcript_15954~~Phypoly_transcript_15954.p1  ORF type:complete len:215 (+),score=34.49 Phypoly_transcript_15954:71-715(+)
MIKAIAVCLLLAFLGFASAATPSTPVWPKEFSSTVFVWNVSDPQAPPEFFRWFQSLPSNSSRRDQIVQFDPKLPPAFVKILVNGSSSLERIIYELPDGQIGCIQRPIRRHLITPDFSQFVYVGQVIINDHILNQWNAKNNGTGPYLSYFENSFTREPYRFRAFSHTGNEETINFTEFDEGPQDPALFYLSPILGAICTAAPSMPSNEFLMKHQF